MWYLECWHPRFLMMPTLSSSVAPKGIFITIPGAINCSKHYCDGIMGAMSSQITSLMIVYSTVHAGADQRKHQSSASLAFVRGIHRWPVNSSHKWPVTRKMFPFDDVIMSLVSLELLCFSWVHPNDYARWTRFVLVRRSFHWSFCRCAVCFLLWHERRCTNVAVS